jgi:hypothetical protein
MHLLRRLLCVWFGHAWVVYDAALEWPGRKQVVEWLVCERCGAHRVDGLWD